MHTDYRFSSFANAAQRSEIRELLKRAQMPGLISLAGGIPAAQAMDVEGLRQATQAALSGEVPSGLQYGMTEGQAVLREQLLRRMKAEGMAPAPDELLVTSGSQQGIDLLARAFLQEGDTVLVEAPAYLAATQAFALTGAEVRAVEGDAQGMHMAQLRAMARHVRPKLLYLVSNFSNPSGHSWSRERRLELLHWAVEHQVFVVEDDPYGELWFHEPPAPSLRTLASEVPGALAWCGYMSSLSKTVAAGLRVGWVLLPAAVTDVCVRLKQAMDLQTGSFTQEVAAHYLASGRLVQRLPQVRALYRQRCLALVQALRDALGEDGGHLVFDVPSGGMFLWARLPEWGDAAALLPFALQQGVAYVPGAAFYAQAPDPRTLRLSYSNLPVEQAPEAARRLNGALQAFKSQLLAC